MARKKKKKKQGPPSPGGLQDVSQSSADKKRPSAATTPTINLKYASYALGAYSLIYLILFAKVLFSSEPSVFFGSDFVNGVYYTLGTVKKSLLEGAIPYINPYIQTGSILFEEMGAMPFYPFTYLYVFLDVSTGANLFVLFHFVLGSFFMFLLVNRLLVKYFAKSSPNFEQHRNHPEMMAAVAFIAGLVFMLSGFNLLRIYAGHHSMLATAIWLPLVIFTLDKAFEDARYFPAFSLALAFMGLAGHPQIWYYILMLVGLYAFYLTWRRVELSQNKLSAAVKTFSVFLLFSVLGGALFAAQSMPAIFFAKDAAVRGLAANYEFATTYSAPFKALFSLISPGAVNFSIAGQGKLLGPEEPMYWEITAYVGGTSVLFLSYFVAAWRKTLVVGLLLALLALSLILALGKNTPVYYLFYKILPGFSSFRVPGRFFYISAFLIALIIPFGLLSAFYSTLRQHAKALGTFVAICFVLWLLTKVNNRQPLDYGALKTDLLFPLGLILAGGVYLAATKSNRGKKQFPTLLIIAMAFALVEMVRFAHGYIAPVAVKTLHYKQEAVDAIRADHNSPEPFRILTLNYNQQVNIAKHIAAGLHNVNGYSNVTESLNKFYFTMMSRPRVTLAKNMLIHTPKLTLETIRFAEVLNVKYLISGGPFSPALEVAYGPIYKNQREKIFIYKNSKFLPRAYIVYGAKSNTSDDVAYQLLQSGKFPFEREVVVADALTANIAPESSVEAVPSEVKVTSYKAEEIILEASPTKNGILVISDAFQKHWNTYVNGKKQKTLRVNLAFRGVELPPGRHKVVMKYEPPLVPISRTISFIAILLTLGGAVLLIKVPKVREVIDGRDL